MGENRPSQLLNAEFRSLIESLDNHPTVRQTVLSSLDDMDANSKEAGGTILSGRTSVM
jgi:hypothetical protein